MDPCPLPTGWAEGAIAEERRLQAILQRDLCRPLIGIKDPRLARLLPLWTGLMEREGRASTAVIVLRKPSEIAASLARRGLSCCRPALAWRTR